MLFLSSDPKAAYKYLSKKKKRYGRLWYGFCHWWKWWSESKSLLRKKEWCL